MKMER
jgi:hypothetical protein